MKTIKELPRSVKISSGVILALLVLSVSSLTYAQVTSHIRANVYIDNIPVGGLSREEAVVKVQSMINGESNKSLSLVIEGQPYPIQGQDIDLGLNVVDAVERAWKVSRSGNPAYDLTNIIRLPLTTVSIPLETTFDLTKLTFEIASIAELVDEPGKDIRLFIEDGDVEIHTDTKTGYILDQYEAVNAVADAINANTNLTRDITRRHVEPSVVLSSAEKAKEAAERILEERLVLETNDDTFTIYPSTIGDWIVSDDSSPELKILIDEAAVRTHVATIAEEINDAAQSPEVEIDSDGQVIDFIVPVIGRVLDEETAVSEILALLTERMNNGIPENEDGEYQTVTLNVKEDLPEITDVDAQELGIRELIGKASTRFTGSPANRISNIKNGVRFLTGKLIAPGEEFSTINSLGQIDNTTGYLPELVIKENRTVPEYGGGLCQVSTTLFRATMNAGLPITARRNHSYRVSYYERDGDGNFIGPGLDATIYDPNPDFRFVNDTGHHILVQGYVVGDKITFEFYGTRDGRTSSIDGPHTLSTTPAGEPIYADTDTLPPGEVRQIETAHAGGTAVATYTITYPDGTVKEEEYRSLYRSWPARYLVGADPNAPTEETDTTEETPTTESEPPVEAPSAPQPKPIFDL